MLPSVCFRSVCCVVVIHAMSCEPHVQHIKKCDPVSQTCVLCVVVIHAMSREPHVQHIKKHDRVSQTSMAHSMSCEPHVQNIKKCDPVSQTCVLCVVVIHAMSREPHVQHIKKHDPVSRYQSYRHSWTSCRAPGEKTHKNLRWGVREKMLCHDHVTDKVSLHAACYCYDLLVGSFVYSSWFFPKTASPDFH